MASASITTRNTKSGKRFIVRWRNGGRAFPLQHGGSFRTLKEARARRDLIAGELVALRDPADVLRAAGSKPRRPDTLSMWFNRFVESRVDVGDKTRELYVNARDRIVPHLGDRDPHTITPADIADVVAANSELSPGTLRKYKSTWAQVLDFVGVEPVNPVRDKRVKLPSRVSEEISPPTQQEWNLIKKHIAKKLLLPVRVIEALGLRLSECLLLTWTDVDLVNGRVRISRTRTKTASGQRWLAVPGELIAQIDALQPVEDRRADRPVFAPTKAAVRDGLYRACRDARIAAYSPHDLRHRRISLWVSQGFDPVAVKTWSGHSRTSMTLDTYSHLIVDPDGDEWRQHWAAVYVAERAARVVPVWSGEA